MGVVGLRFPWARGVILVVCDGFAMSSPLVFGVYCVIQAPIEGPLVTLLGIGHQVCHDKVTERRPQVLSRPRTEAQRVRPIRGVGSLDNEALQTGDGFVPGFGDPQRIGSA